MLICHLWAVELLKDDVEIFKEGKKSQNMMLQCFNKIPEAMLYACCLKILRLKKMSKCKQIILSSWFPANVEK